MSEIFSFKVFNGTGIEQNLPLSSVKNIKAYKIPDFTQKGKKEWIKYGTKDDYPYFLMALAKSSDIHFDCLLTKANMTAGGGFDFTGEDAEKARQLFKSLGVTKRLHKAFAWDISLFGGTYAQLVTGLDTTAKPMIKKIIRQPFQYVRLGKDEEFQFGTEIKKHYYADEWNKVTAIKDNAKVKELRVYSEGINLTDIYNEVKANKDIKDKKMPNLSYLAGHYTPLIEYYPTPDYLTEASINAILTDIELAKFDLAELVNGMTAGFIITFYREDFSKKDKDKETEIRSKEEEMVKELIGGDNANRTVIQRALPSLHAQKGIEITQIPSTNTSSKQESITKRKNINILAAHGFVTPDLAGIPDLGTSGFSSQAEKLITANEILFYNRINNLQEPLLEFYNLILSRNSLKCEAMILNNMPVRQAVSDIMWQWAFSKDEFRESVGYSTLDPSKPEEKAVIDIPSNTRSVANEPTQSKIKPLKTKKS